MLFRPAATIRGLSRLHAKTCTPNGHLASCYVMRFAIAQSTDTQGAEGEAKYFGVNRLSRQDSELVILLS